MKKEKNYETKDSGKRIEFSSGFHRDTNEGKPRPDLVPPELLLRLAELYARGASKYGDNNWRLASTDVEIHRFKESAWRHFIQWSKGDQDEDHGSAVMFNIMSYIWHTEYKNNIDVPIK